MKKISFGAGCFWGVEMAFINLPGVVSTQVGYQGGRTNNPTYEEICYHQTGHIEVTLITYNPAEIGLNTLLERFWAIHDPTLINQQGPDKGSQYQSAIFFDSDADDDRIIIEDDIKRLEQSGLYDRPISTLVKSAQEFPYFNAEEEHQKYLVKNPGGYCHINLEQFS